MTYEMIVTIGITVFMIALIMHDKLPFGAPPLIACLLLVVFGVSDIKSAFGGFANSTIVMLAEFMALIAALQKTDFTYYFKNAMFNMANKGGFKAYVVVILIVMLGCSLFGTGSTAYYVLTLGLLSTLPYNKSLPPSKVIMSAGFAANHPLIPLNTALLYGVLIAVLGSAGANNDVSVIKFAIVNVILSLAFIFNCIIQYKFLPDHPICDENVGEGSADAPVIERSSLPKWKQQFTYFVFIIAVIGMILQGKIGDAGYAVAGLCVFALMVVNVLDFAEIRDAVSAPIILMSAGVIGIANALGDTGLTAMVGEYVANLLGHDVNPFILIFSFCILTSLLATLTGSTIGTVFVFAPMAIASCQSMGLDPTAAACAIVASGWCGHFLPIDGMPAMVMGIGKYNLVQFWKFTIPQYFIRLLALTAGSILVFPLS